MNNVQRILSFICVICIITIVGCGYYSFLTADHFSTLEKIIFTASLTLFIALIVMKSYNKVIKDD